MSIRVNKTGILFLNSNRLSLRVVIENYHNKALYFAKCYIQVLEFSFFQNLNMDGNFL